MDSRQRTRRASEVYNVASEEDPVDGMMLALTERYRDDIFVDAAEDNCWTTVEEVALQMERHLRDEHPEDTKPSVKQKSPRRSFPFSPKKSPQRTLANAAIESPKQSSKKSPKNSPKKSPKSSPKRSPKNSPKKSPSAPKKVLPGIIESPVQKYRPVYQMNLTNTNLVPVPYTPRSPGNSTTATFRVPVAAPRSFVTKTVTTLGEEKARKEEECSKAKESKDTRGRIKKTPKNTQKSDEETDDVKQSPIRSSQMNIRECLKYEEDAHELQGEAQDDNDTVVNEAQKLSRPNSLILRDTVHGGKGGKAGNMPATRVTSFTASDNSSDSQEAVVRKRRVSLELDPEESLALSTLEAVVMEGPNSTILYSCSNQPFNSFEELEAMKDKAVVRPHDTDTKSSEEISSEKKLSDLIHRTQDTDEVNCVDILAALDDSTTDERHDSLPSDQESAERCNTDSILSDYTLSRDSLEGFLNDDIKSLRSFVAQKNLDVANLSQEPEKKSVDDSFEEIEGIIRQKPEKRKESIDFTFEEVDDSPSHVVMDKTTEEKKTVKRSPKLSRFTQKVSDKNKENEEKSKISSFRPRNILLFGSKEKNKMKGKPKTPGSDTPKTEGWTSEAIEEYLLKNNREETLRLGLLNEDDVVIHEAKMEGNLNVPDNRKAPEVLVNDEVKPTTPGQSCRKRQAPIPPQRKSPSWRPQDIENYLLEHNMNENLRLGLLSQEDIQIFEWKRATGMSPICDTSWTRETLRKNKVIRGSSSSSLSSSMSPSPEVERTSVVPSPARGAEGKTFSERPVDVPCSPQVMPARRRARAPQPPACPSVTRTFPATTSTPTSTRKVTGHFAFRGFKLGQRVGKGVGGGISRLGQAMGDRATSAGVSSQTKPGSPCETRPEVSKPEVSRPRKLGLDRIGVKLPGLTSRDTSPAAAAATEGSSSSAGTPVTDDPEPEEEVISGVQQRRRETPYRKLARLLGKEPPPPPAPPAEVPSHALFLRETPRPTATTLQDDEESGIRKKLSDMRLRLGWLRRRGEGQVSVRPQPEEAQSWAESFHNLMASKYGQALFKAFLQREFSEENVEFWLAVEDFKKTRAAKMPSKASKIHSDYVAVQAPKEINLDPGTRAQIAKSLDCPDKYIFDAAQKRVQALMESDAYLRFLQSELYKELLHPESSPSNPDAL